ncbi:MAG: hypothetical protein RLZ37_2236, partial [Actinomycetota bacterium]
VDVRMGQHDGIEGRGVDRELLPVASTQGPIALELSAIDENLRSVGSHVKT